MFSSATVASGALGGGARSSDCFGLLGTPSANSCRADALRTRYAVVTEEPLMEMRGDLFNGY